MPDIEKIRVRFAPSPTGHLHIGGARTALFNYLFARHQGGTFVLRIEDTDRTRSTEEYIETIIEGMKWLGLHWDEGPYRQTDRFDVYKGLVEKLLRQGNAYHCYCTPEELDERRKKALAEGRPPRYDGRCRNLSTPPAGIMPAVRFKMPQEGRTVVNDLIRGAVEFENNQLDDLIIMRSDGTPTYNFVVVADDVEMKITHVIRGDDHLNNTPKQLHIYKSLGYEIPKFAHLPMILGADKTRLSKRHGATSVLAYKDMGYLPEALINYLVRLGWSYGDQEVFNQEELIKYFSLESIGKAAAVFNPEKLLWLNSEYIKAAPPDRLRELVMPFLLSEGTEGLANPTVKPGEELDKEWLEKAILTLTERCRTLVELAKALKYYIAEYVEIDEKARAKFLTQGALPYLKELVEELTAASDWRAAEIEKVFISLTERHNIKLGNVAQPVRVAITGNTVSPGIFEVLEIVGRDKTLKRLKKAMDMISGGGPCPL